MDKKKFRRPVKARFKYSLIILFFIFASIQLSAFLSFIRFYSIAGAIMVTLSLLPLAMLPLWFEWVTVDDYGIQFCNLLTGPRYPAYIAWHDMCFAQTTKKYFGLQFLKIKKEYGFPAYLPWPIENVNSFKTLVMHYAPRNNPLCEFLKSSICSGTSVLTME